MTIARPSPLRTDPQPEPRASSPAHSSPSPASPRPPVPPRARLDSAPVSRRLPRSRRRPLSLCGPLGFLRAPFLNLLPSRVSPPPPFCVLRPPVSEAAPGAFGGPLFGGSLSSVSVSSVGSAPSLVLVGVTDGGICRWTANGCYGYRTPVRPASRRRPTRPGARDSMTAAGAGPATAPNEPARFTPPAAAAARRAPLPPPHAPAPLLARTLPLTFPLSLIPLFLSRPSTRTLSSSLLSSSHPTFSSSMNRKRSSPTPMRRWSPSNVRRAPPVAEEPAISSGGNQHKLVLARELEPQS